MSDDVNIYKKHLEDIYGGAGKAAETIRKINQKKVLVLPVDPQGEDEKRTDKQDSHLEQSGQSNGTVRTVQQSSQDSPTGQSGQSSRTDKQDSHLEQSLNDDGWLDLPLLSRTELEKKATIIRSHNHRRVFNFIQRVDQRTFFTTYEQIGVELAMPPGTVRKAIALLKDLNIIQNRRFWDKPRRTQGQEIMYLGPLSGSSLGTDKQDSHLEQSASPSKIDRFLEEEKDKKNQSIKERLLKITNSQMQALFPKLTEAGFTVASLHEAVELRELTSASLDPIMKYLGYAEFELENGGIKDKDGNTVERVDGYVFNTISKGRAYRKPKNFIDPDILELEEEAKRKRALFEKKRAFEEEMFALWENSLTPSRLDMFEKERNSHKPFPLPKDVFLKNKWREEFDQQYGSNEQHATGKENKVPGREDD